MNVLTRYIVMEVFKGSMVVLLLLITLFNLFSFSDQLRALGKGSYGLKQIIWYLLFTSPTLFYELMPSAALLGSLFVVGAMANNREIVAMRAAGLSTAWIVRTIMLAGLLLVALSVAVGETIAPQGERNAQLLKITSQHNEVVMPSQYGMWWREGNRFINVRKIIDNSTLSDVRIYEIDDQHKLIKITQAESAKLQGEKQWLLENVKQSEMGRQQIFAGQSATSHFQSVIDSDLLKLTVVDSDNLSLYDLFNYVDFLKQNNQKSRIYEMAFWGRLINPLVTFIMLMVSAPFVIGIGRGVSAGKRIMTGLVIGIAFNIMDKIIGNMGLIYDVNPMLIAMLPSALVFCGASYALWRVS